MSEKAVITITQKGRDVQQIAASHLRAIMQIPRASEFSAN
jgi:hypothetical protein